VAAWCALPIAWGSGQPRDGFRSPPKLGEGDPARILFAAWPHGLEVEILNELGGAASALDEALERLAGARYGGDSTEIADAGDNAESCLEDFYDALRATLHPDKMAAEEES
jgi:hypothetical protein